jgi:hypothetical protein
MPFFERWVALWSRREGGESLALVRIAVALVILWDLGEVARFGLVEALWAAFEEGAIGAAAYERPVALLYGWLGASARNAWLLFAAICIAAFSLAIGLLSWASALLLLLSYAELSRLLPYADRGIATLLRKVLAVLVFARCAATLSLAARFRLGRFRARPEVSAWPRYLIIAQLVLLYFSAGVLKQPLNWSSGGGYAARFLVLHKPHLVRHELPHDWLVAGYSLLQAGTLSTVVGERSAPLLPLLLWLRGTKRRGGRLRHGVERSRLLEVWVATGVIFHLALAAPARARNFPLGLPGAVPGPGCARDLVALGRRVRRMAPLSSATFRE